MTESRTPPSEEQFSSAPSRESFANLVVALLLIAHANLLAHSAIVHSPAYDEVGHLPAGLMVLQQGRFDLYRVNPPLVKAAAAAAAWLAGADARGLEYDAAVTVRPEWRVGREMIDRARVDPFPYWTYARWACIPFSVLAGWLCYRWAGRLFGPGAGLLAATLWCFCPNVLGNAAMITPDVGATALGLWAAYSFSRWLQQPGPHTVLTAGVSLGLAELTKMTWLILFGLWPLLWVADRWLRRGSAESAPGPAPSVGQLALILFVGWNVLNTGYLWQGTFTPLGDFPFQSATLTGRPVPEDGGQGEPAPVGNRFAGTGLAHVPVPFPWDYVVGLDVQKLDFERKKWSYLCGEHKLGGWWYYYLVALALKVPLGFWLIGLAAIGYSLRRGEFRAPAADRLVLTVLPLAIFVLISSQTGFSRYLRYLLPAFPFAFVGMGRAAEAFRPAGWTVGKLWVGASLAWGVGSSLWYFPHSLSYFNELAGGPKQGHRCLVDANISWGQDAFYLRDWIQSHPEARPLTYAYISFFDLRTLGIQGSHTPSFHPDRSYPPSEALQAGPRPGWHIVDVNYLHSHRRHYDYFQMFEPVDYVAYSMHVFHLTLEQANEARRRLGLPLLEAPPPPAQE